MTTKAKATTAPAMKLLTGVAALEKEWAAIGTAGASLQGRVHVALCSTLAHVGKHKDIRIIDVAMNALPAMVRKQAVQKWFTAFGPVEFDGDDVLYVKGKPTKQADAQANPFHGFNPKLDYVPLTDEAINGMIDKLAKRLKTDAKKTHRDHSAMIQALAKIVPANTLAA